MSTVLKTLNLKALALVLTLVPIAAAHADDVGQKETAESIKIEEPTASTSSASLTLSNQGGTRKVDQLVTLQIGQFTPNSIQTSNGAYNFNYGHGTSFLAEGGWALKILSAGTSGGSFYFEENLAYSSFSGNSVQNVSVPNGSSSYTLDLFGFDTRLMYAADWFPLTWITPFVDGGYQLSIYYQPGSSGLDSTEGGVGNPVAGAGARILLNPGAFTSGGNPIYLSGKYNRIFSVSNSVDLASSSFMGGLSLGL
jgi:hypothetical protein